MLKIADKDKDFVYVYSEDPEEINKAMNLFEISCTTTYGEGSALVVRKTKSKTKSG